MVSGSARSSNCAEVAAHPQCAIGSRRSPRPPAKPRPRRSATSRPLAATCCSARDAGTSAIQTSTVSKRAGILVTRGRAQPLSRDPRRRPLLHRAPLESRARADRLGASLRIVGPQGERTVALEQFFTLPKADPTRENVLKPGEVITRSASGPASRSRSVYLEVREKQSFDWPLVSIAVVSPPTMPASSRASANRDGRGRADPMAVAGSRKGHQVGSRLDRQLARRGQRKRRSSRRNRWPITATRCRSRKPSSGARCCAPRGSRASLAMTVKRKFCVLLRTKSGYFRSPAGNA